MTRQNSKSAFYGRSESVRWREALGMPKAIAAFDADDSRLSGALARINGKMLALQSRITKFAINSVRDPSGARGDFDGAVRTQRSGVAFALFIKAIVDRGYRGAREVGGTQILVPGKGALRAKQMPAPGHAATLPAALRH